MNTTITVINDKKDIICDEPLYYARNSSPKSLSSPRSRIDAHPLSHPRFNEIGFVQLHGGQKAVLIAPQKDGSIRLGGPYVDMIAKELDIESPEEAAADKAEWPRAVNEGWPTAALVA
jgi:hypothetical protein